VTPERLNAELTRTYAGHVSAKTAYCHELFKRYTPWPNQILCHNLLAYMPNDEELARSDACH
jgi:hypothetical protein